MNEVTKLYENAGINKIFKYYECSYGTSSIQVCPIPLGDCIGMCDRKSIWDYPPFTAEKQLELIKWLSKRRLLNIAFSNDKSTYQLFNDKCTGSFCSDLATAIATLVQCELDFCTEEEKQQVKDILQ